MNDGSEPNNPMTAHLPRFAGLGGTVLLDMGEAGAWLVDASGEQPNAQAGTPESPADCTIRAEADVMAKLLNGTLNPMLAFTLGKIKVSGRMEVVMKLQAILGKD